MAELTDAQLRRASTVQLPQLGKIEDPSLRGSIILPGAQERLSSDYLREQNRLGWEKHNEGNLEELDRSVALRNGITAGLGILNGANEILAASLPAAQIRQTPGFNYKLNNLRMYGNMNFDTNEQLANSYDQTNFGLRQNERIVRGMNGWQKAGTIGSAMASGANAGSVFGPYGALAGAAIGGLFAGANTINGDTAAYNRTQADNLNVQFAQQDANQNRLYQADRLEDRNYRFNQSHPAARGGQIETQREQESLQQFANRVLHRKDSILPKRTYQKGGVCVKIRTK